MRHLCESPILGRWRRHPIPPNFFAAYFGLRKRRLIGCVEKTAGLTHLGDFHHKMRKTGRHCEAAQPTKQSITISVLCASGLLPAAFLAVAMTMNL
jgi:hypothetical protein